MDSEEERLNRLSELLHALSVQKMTMTLSTFDGYVTGVLACPENIPPSDWLPAVCGETGGVFFADKEAADKTIAAFMSHYDSVADEVTQSAEIKPIFKVARNSDETFWEPWVIGFIWAMRLRPDAWKMLLAQADEETCTAMISLMALYDICTGEGKFSDEELDEIYEEAPHLIPSCVTTLLRRSRPEMAATTTLNFPGVQYGVVPRPERNNSCACGSGRKYKLCCGRN